MRAAPGRPGPGARSLSPRTFSMASTTSCRPSELEPMLGAKPPSSPTLQASWPYLPLMIDLRLWYTSLPMRIASVKLEAPTGSTMNSCIASALPAWLPPLMMLNAGTGSTSFELPASSAMCLYSGTPFSAAPALHTAMDTASTAFAPSLPLFLVPSSSTIISSSLVCSRGSCPSSAGAISSLMFFTAPNTLLPMYADLSPSRSSTAS